jgi:tripartite-type tricarboxylate transporter receptor subunit TctC
MTIKLLCLTVALLMGLPGADAWAQADYPTRTVTIVVGYPAGTPVDTIARVIATNLSERLHQTVIVENKPGAGSSIGAAAVAKAAPDGYTLYLSSSANSVNPSMNKLPFDFSKDLAPVTIVANSPVLLVVPPSGPHTIKDLIAQAKQKPGAFAFGSSGAGTATHLFAELFAHATGTKLTHVPYKGSSQTVTDLLAARIQLMFSPAGTVLPHVKAGKLRALAISGKDRLADLPDVPTFDQAGIPGLNLSLWFGLNTTAGTPAPVIAKLNKEVAAVLALPAVKAKLVPQLILPVSSGSKEFGDFVDRDIARWKEVVKAAGLKPNY